MAVADDPQTRAGAKIRERAEEKRNVVTRRSRLLVGGKLSAFRETAEIPLKPRSARIRKGSLSAPFSPSLSLLSPPFRILFLSLSLSVILSCTFSRRVTSRSRAQPLNSKLLSPQSASHQRSRRLGSSFPPFSLSLSLSVCSEQYLTSSRDFLSNNERRAHARL